MKHFITYFFLVFALSSFAESDEFMPQIWLQSITIDTSLTPDQAVFEFHFENAPDENHELTYSIDGTNHASKLTERGLRIITTPGNHIFQFYYSSDFEEVYTDSLTIGNQRRSVYTVNMFPSLYPVMSEKPIIYLYPTAATDVNVKLDIKGERQFLYPSYADGWEFTANPNGDLDFGDKTYNYLFWEATGGSDLVSNDGFVIAGNKSTEFLEKTLGEIGFTAKEQADFITYWAPRLQQNEFNFIQFVLNDNCDQYATIDISPKPDNIYRIYMLWTGVNENFEAVKQALPLIDRSGFSVLEWGGQQTRFRRINCMAPLKATL
jgi:hypothetical protein